MNSTRPACVAAGEMEKREAERRAEKIERLKTLDMVRRFLGERPGFAGVEEIKSFYMVTLPGGRVGRSAYLKSYIITLPYLFSIDKGHKYGGERPKNGLNAGFYENLP